MTRKAFGTIGLLLFIVVLCLTSAFFGGCVSSDLALRMETSVNSPIMKNLQDNDEDLFQIEDGIGAVGEAAACPT
jgi:hypothetical protein